MNIIIPVLPGAKAECEHAKRSVDGHPLAAHLALRAKTLPGVKVFVFVRDSGLRDALVLAGLDVHLDARDQGPEASPHLAGGREALEYLVGQGLLDRQSPVVLADWRNTSLSLDSLGRALEKAQAGSDTLCASFGEVRDSPVQCHVPQRVLFLDHFVFPESVQVAREVLGDTGGEVGLSRPLYFNWQAHDVIDVGHAVYAAASNRHSPIIRFTPVSLRSEAAWPSSWAYYHERPLVARRVVRNPEPCGALEAGIPVQVGGLPSPVAVWRDPDDGNVVCRVAKAALPEDFILRIWPLRGLSKEPGLETRPIRAEDRMDAEVEFRFASAEATDSVILCALAANCGNEYDFTEQVSGGERLWAVDPTTKARIDPATGAVLANRQQFPVFWELDGAVVAGRVETILDFVHAVSIAPLPLGREERAKIREEWGSPDAPVGAGLPVGEQADRSGAVLNPDQDLPEKRGSEREEVSPQPESDVYLAGLHELGQALSELRAVKDGRAAGFSELVDRVKGLFASQSVRVEEVIWKYDRLKAYTLEYLTRARCDKSLDVIVDSQVNRFLAIKVALREAARDYENTMETVGMEGFGSIEASPAPAGRMSKPFLRPLDPGAPFPFIPRALTSDGVSRLFLSAYDDRGWGGGIYIKDVVSGEVTSWGEEKRSYGSIWYDRQARLLYAMPRTKGEHRVSGIDVFDDGGRCVESVSFQNDQGEPLYAAYCLNGNEDSLFFGEAFSWSVKVLNKRNFALKDTIRIQIADYFSSFIVYAQSLYMSTRHKHIFVRKSLADDTVTVFSGTHTAFPGHMALDQKDKMFYVSCSEHEPHAQERQGQWVKRFDKDMNFIDSCRLGQQNVLDVHVIEEARVLAVADNWDGLQLFRIS